MGFTKDQPVYPKIYYAIMANKKLQSWDRKQALAEIRRMHNDPVYARIVNYIPREYNRELAVMFVWSSTDSGYSFWHDIADALNK